MIQCQKQIDEKQLPVQMLLQIHDELVFEVEQDKVDLVKPILTAAMENAMKLDVPLAVNAEVGTNLAK